jgi:hypothetical protein
MSWRTLLGAFCMLCMGTVFGFVPGLVLGAMGGNRQAYHLRYLEERELIEPIIASDPTFSEVTIHEKSDGGLYLGGEVPTHSDRARLEQKVNRAIGEKRAHEAISNVSEKEK